MRWVREILFVGTFLLLSSAQELIAFSFELEPIKKHIDEKFAKARIETYPFPHLTIENILPEDLYIELLKNWPRNCFNAHKQQSIAVVGSFNQNLDSSEIWIQFASLVVDQLIKRKAAEMFREYSFLRFNQPIPGQCLCNASDLLDHRLVEERGPGISPHVDQGYIFAAMAIYFPDRDDYNHTNLGTYFYTHKNDKTSADVCFDNNVTEVRSAAYKPNTLSVWLQTSRSWHSGPLIFADRNYTRKFYLSLIYLSPDFMKMRFGHLFGLSEGFLDESYLY